MEQNTDYGKLALLKAEDLSRRILYLESKKESAAEKLNTCRGAVDLNATLIYLSSAEVCGINMERAGKATFFFRVRLENTIAPADCYIYFYAGASLIAGGLATVNQGKQEFCFMGGCNLTAGSHNVTVRIEGLTGRKLISADYCITGAGVALSAADNFLSVCVDDNNLMYACYSLPDGTTKVTNNSGASWRSLFTTGNLGKTALTLTERGGVKKDLRLITIQNGKLYAFEESSAGRVIEPSGVTFACAYQMKGCDDVFNIVFIKGNKAYYTETGLDYFCKPVPVLAGTMFSECYAVIKSPEPMFILTKISGGSIMVTAENITSEAVKTRTVSAATEAVNI